MKIFIMRHGEAEMWAVSDSQRLLTEKGKTQAYQQGLWLKQYQQDCPFDKVLVSPFVRAQQTFEQVNLACSEQLSSVQETWQGITPNGSVRLLHDYLDVLQQQGIQTLLIISHLPLVDEIVREFCGRSEVSFYPATIALIECSEEQGRFICAKYTADREK